MERREVDTPQVDIVVGLLVGDTYALGKDNPMQRGDIQQACHRDEQHDDNTHYRLQQLKRNDPYQMSRSQLEILLHTEFQTIQARRKLVRQQVTQFAREDDDIVAILVVLAGIEARRAAIAEAQDGEEDLEGRFAVEAIGDDRR